MYFPIDRVSIFVIVVSIFVIVVLIFVIVILIFVIVVLIFVLTVSIIQIHKTNKKGIDKAFLLNRNNYNHCMCNLESFPFKRNF